MTDSVLLPHPATLSSAAHALTVQVRRERGGGLALRYRLRGELDRLQLPPPSAPERCDGLWAHTCFELFVAAPGARAYREYNFSPSGRWAAYAFRDYRQRDGDEAVAPPPIRVRAADGLLELETRIAAPSGLLPTQPLQLGLTAVVEDVDGALSYWALRHAGARPDFHLRDSFALTLGPAGVPPATEGAP